MQTPSVSVTFDPASVAARLRARWQRGLPELSARILADCNRYARDDSGTLIRSSHTASNLTEGRLAWRTAYARRVYYTGTPRTRRNGGASLRWCEKAKTLHGSQWAALAAQQLGGNTP